MKILSVLTFSLVISLTINSVTTKETNLGSPKSTSKGTIKPAVSSSPTTTAKPGKDTGSSNSTSKGTIKPVVSSTTAKPGKDSGSSSSISKGTIKPVVSSATTTTAKPGKDTGSSSSTSKGTIKPAVSSATTTTAKPGKDTGSVSEHTIKPEEKDSTGKNKKKTDSKDGLSGGEKFGIVIVSLALLGVVVGGLICFIRRRRVLSARMNYRPLEDELASFSTLNAAEA